MKSRYIKRYNKVISVIKQFPKFVCNKQIEKNTSTIYHLYHFEYIDKKDRVRTRVICFPLSLYENKSSLFIAISTRLPGNIFKKNILKRILCRNCVRVAKKIPKLQNLKLYYDSFQLQKNEFKQHIFLNCRNNSNPEPNFIPEDLPPL